MRQAVSRGGRPKPARLVSPLRATVQLNAHEEERVSSRSANPGPAWAGVRWPERPGPLSSILRVGGCASLWAGAHVTRCGPSCSGTVIGCGVIGRSGRLVQAGVGWCPRRATSWTPRPRRSWPPRWTRSCRPDPALRARRPRTAGPYAVRSPHPSSSGSSGRARSCHRSPSASQGVDSEASASAARAAGSPSPGQDEAAEVRGAYGLARQGRARPVPGARQPRRRPPTARGAARGRPAAPGPPPAPGRPGARRRGGSAPPRRRARASSCSTVRPTVTSPPGPSAERAPAPAPGPGPAVRAYASRRTGPSGPAAVTTVVVASARTGRPRSVPASATSSATTAATSAGAGDALLERGQRRGREDLRHRCRDQHPPVDVGRHLREAGLRRAQHGEPARRADAQHESPLQRLRHARRAGRRPGPRRRDGRVGGAGGGGGRDPGRLGDVGRGPAPGEGQEQEGDRGHEQPVRRTAIEVHGCSTSGRGARFLPPVGRAREARGSSAPAVPPRARGR